MNKEMFITELNKLNIECSEENLDTLENYYKILCEYNNHTNLTRIIEKEDVYLKHFYDSLTINKVIDLNNINSLLDIGSGAGFPGVVIKIFYPNINVTCLDSNNKKTRFLTHLSEKLNLDLKVVNDRAENYVRKKINSFDIVTARAVANLRVLTELSAPFVKKNGYFIAMKGNLSEETKEATRTIEKLNMTIEENIEFKLPYELSERTILKLKKCEDSKISNIRTYEKILKTSL